jgi:hypothetical protein
MAIDSDELKTLLRDNLRVNIQTEQKSFGCDGGAAYITVQLLFGEEVLSESWITISGAEVS